MSKRNLIKAYNKLIDTANKAQALGDFKTFCVATEEAKFIMELIEETK